MNKAEFVHAVATRTGTTPRYATVITNAVIDVIMETLAAGDNIVIAGFGTFEPAARAARVGRNPHTGEAIDVPAKVAPKFKPSQTFKNAVNK